MNGMQRSTFSQTCLSSTPGVIAPGRVPLSYIPIAQQRRQMAVRSVNLEDSDASAPQTSQVPHHHALSRRNTALLGLCSVATAAIPDQPSASAAGFNKTKRRKLTEDDYVMSGRSVSEWMYIATEATACFIKTGTSFTGWQWTWSVDLKDVGLRIVELDEGSGNERIKAGDKATVRCQIPKIIVMKGLALPLTTLPTAAAAELSRLPEKF
eukprot:1141918-Pelagomonas_calceolata.AAC.5